MTIDTKELKYIPGAYLEKQPEAYAEANKCVVNGNSNFERKQKP